MKIYVPISDLRIIKDSGKDVLVEKPKKGGPDGGFMKGAEVKTEIDIRGHNIDEAELVLDKYIDDAVRAHI